MITALYCWKRSLVKEEEDEQRSFKRRRFGR